MSFKRILFQRSAAAAAGVLLAVSGLSAGAQAWKPEKSVEILVSSSPGGSNDRIARVIQQIVRDHKLAPVSISVVNRPGGNQTLSRTYINQFPGDPHYMDIGNPTLIANTVSGLQPYTDFTPIALMVNEYTAFSVRADSPINNARDLVAQLRNDPDSVAIGVSNRGGTNHLAMSLLAKEAGIDPRRLKVVVFKTNAEGLAGVMGGHIQLVASAIATGARAAVGGKTKIVSITATQRMGGDLANVPTLQEQGYDVSLSNWRALIGPRGLTPQQVIYWENVLSRVITTDEWKGVLVKQHWDGNFLRSPQFAAYMKKEYEQTRAIMMELGLAK
jgi:putative tricarboxylic transport membrane protein